MTNAFEELNAVLLDVMPKNECAILCAKIVMYKGEENERHILLKQNHTDEEFKKFFNELNFVYDNGFGAQELFGIVWLTKDCWLERGVYDGSEWWDFKSYPEISEELK